MRRLAAGLLLALGCAAGAAPTLDAWRAEAARVRMLAENDLSAAHEAALRLRAALPPDATAADHVNALNVLTRVEVYQGQTELAGQHAEQALAMATSAGDRIGQAEADLNIALNSVNQGRIERLREATTHSLAVLEGVQRPDLLVEAMLRTAVMYRRYGQLEESVTMAMQAMEVARESRHSLALAYAHQGLGIAHAQSFRRADALAHFSEMLKHARAAPSRLLQAAATMGLADHSTANGELREGERLYREAWAMYRATGAPLYAAHAVYGLSDNLVKQGRQQEALPLLKQMVEAYRRHSNPIGLWYTLNLLSEAELQLKNLKSALDHGQEAYRIAQSIGFPLYLSGSAQRLAALSAAQGDYRRAHEYHQEAAAAANKATDERASTRMLELTEHYKAQAQDRAIEELRHRNELQTAELRQRTLQQRWLWTVLGTVVLALIGIAYFMLRLRRSHEAIRQLNASLEQRVQAATAELREQTSYLRTLIDTLPLMVWLKDTDGRFLALNEATARTGGRSVGEMVGHADHELWPEPVVQLLQAADREVIEGHARKTLETPLPVGEPGRWYEIHMAPVLDGEKVLGLVGAAHDVSLRKAAEQARELALEEAKSLARQRSEFLAQMSHELRTPLNGILGFAQILKRDKPLTDRQVRGLGVIEQSGQHLLALINDILDLARIDAAKLELNPTEVELQSFLAVVTDIVRVKAEEKHLLFSRHFDQRMPHSVKVDEKRLRQVLLNLLSNAVKFTDKGEVSLTVSLASPGTDSARIRFEVKDSGVGMNEQQLAKLFQPFEQVGDAKRREGGTGLGLAISKQLVRLMKGDIGVSSEPGRGSCFWFEIELPVVQRGAPASGQLPGRPIGYEGKRRRILVADDVAQNRAVLVEGLAQLGFEVHEAADGEAALELALAVRPDLVVMDLTMPRMDGYQAMRRLHASAGLAQLPVIAASGNASLEVEEEARRAGAAAFLRKPIDQEALLAAVGRLLDLRWIREGVAEALSEPQAWLGDDTPLPPTEQLEELYRLVRMGHMRRICEQADALERSDARYAPLSRHVRALAQACQSKSLLQLVERLRTAPTTPT